MVCTDQATYTRTHTQAHTHAYRHASTFIQTHTQTYKRIRIRTRWRARMCVPGPRRSARSPNKQPRGSCLLCGTLDQSQWKRTHVIELNWLCVRRASLLCLPVRRWKLASNPSTQVLHQPVREAQVRTGRESFGNVRLPAWKKLLSSHKRVLSQNELVLVVYFCARRYLVFQVLISLVSSNQSSLALIVKHETSLKYLSLSIKADKRVNKQTKPRTNKQYNKQMNGKTLLFRPSVITRNIYV